MADVNVNDPDFANVFYACEKVSFGKFYKHDGFLFREINCLCLIVLCVNCLCVKLMGGGGFNMTFWHCKDFRCFKRIFFLATYET